MDPNKLEIIVNTLRDAKLYITRMRELSYLMFITDTQSVYDYNDDLKEIFKELRNFSIDFSSIISLVVDTLNFEEIYADYLKIKNNSDFLLHNLHVLNPDIIDDEPEPDFIPQNQRNTILTIDSVSKIIRSDIQLLKSKFKNFEVNRLITNYEKLISSFNLDVYTRKLEFYKGFRDKLLVYVQRIDGVLSNYQLTIDKINTVILLIENPDHKQVLLSDKRLIETFKIDLEKTNFKFNNYLKQFDLFYNSILYFIEKLTTIRSNNELLLSSSNNINKFLTIKSKINTVENNLIQVKNSLSTSDLLENTTFSQIYIDRFGKFRKELLNRYAILKLDLDKLLSEWFIDFKEKFVLNGFTVPDRYKPNCNSIDCMLSKYNLNPDLILLKTNFFRDLFYIYNLSNTDGEPDIKIIRNLLNKFNFNMFFSSISYHIESFNTYNFDMIRIICQVEEIVSISEINFVDSIFRIHYLKIKNKMLDHVSSLYNLIEDFVKLKFTEEISNEKLLDNPYIISKMNSNGELDGTGVTYSNKSDFCFYILESTSPFGISNSYLTFLNSEVKFDKEIKNNNRIFTFESAYGIENNIIIKIEQLVCGLTKEKFEKIELDISVATSMKNTLFPAKSYINPNFYGFSILIGYGNIIDNNDHPGFFISCENLDRIILNKFEVNSNKSELSIFLNHEYNETTSTPNSRIEVVEKLELTDKYSLYNSQSLNAIYEFTYLELASLSFDTKYANLCINDLIGLGITNLNLSNYYYLINNLPQNGAGLTKLYDIDRLEQLIKEVKSNFKSYLKSKLSNWIPNDYKYTLAKPKDLTNNIIEDFNKKYIEVILNKLANEINDYASIIKYEKDYILENYIESLIFSEFGIDSYDYRKAIYDNDTEINNLKLFFDSELNTFVKNFTSGSGFSIYEREFFNKIMDQYYILYNYGISEFSSWIDLLLSQKYKLRGLTKKEAIDNLFNKLFKNNIYINFDEFSTLRRNFEDFQSSLKTAIYDSVSIIINIFYMDTDRINTEYTFQCVHYKNLIKKTDDIIELINNLLKSYSNKINNINDGKKKIDIKELLFEKKITELKTEIDNYNIYMLCSLIIPSFEKDWSVVGDINNKKLKELFLLCNKFDNIDIRNFKSYILGLKKSLAKQKIDNFSKLVNLTVGEFKALYPGDTDNDDDDDDDDDDNDGSGDDLPGAWSYLLIPYDLEAGSNRFPVLAYFVESNSLTFEEITKLINVNDIIILDNNYDYPITILPPNSNETYPTTLKNVITNEVTHIIWKCNMYPNGIPVRERATAKKIPFVTPDINNIDLSKSAIFVAHFDDEAILFQPLLDKVAEIKVCIYAIGSAYKDTTYTGTIYNDLKPKINYGNKVSSIWSSPTGKYNTPTLDGAFDISNLAERDTFFLDNDILKNQIRLSILELKSKGITSIITHSPWGDYGHRHHSWVFSFVYEIASVEKMDVWILPSYRNDSSLSNSNWVNTNIGFSYICSSQLFNFDLIQCELILNAFKTTFIPDTNIDLWTWHETPYSLIANQIFPTSCTNLVMICGNFNKKYEDILSDTHSKYTTFKKSFQYIMTQIDFRYGLRNTPLITRLLTKDIDSETGYRALNGKWRTYQIGVSYLECRDFQEHESEILSLVQNGSIVYCKDISDPTKWNAIYIYGNGITSLLNGTRVITWICERITWIMSQNSTIYIKTDLNSNTVPANSSSNSKNLKLLTGTYIVESSSETEEDFHHKLYVDFDSISSMNDMLTIKSKLPVGTTVYFDSNINVKGSIRTIEDEFIVANIPKFYAACPRLVLYGTMDSQIFNDLVKVKASIEDDGSGNNNWTRLPGEWACWNPGLEGGGFNYITCSNYGNIDVSELYKIVTTNVIVYLLEDKSIFVSIISNMGPSDNTLFWKCSSMSGNVTTDRIATEFAYIVKSNDDGGGDDEGGGGDPSIPDVDDGGDYIDASNKLLKDYTLFDFTLLSTDYINSYQIPKNIPDMIKNSAPNIFSEQRYSPLPLSSNPLDSESIYQFCRSPRFDNMLMMMEDTISQPFNSMHMYFNSNKYKLDKFGGIDNSSIGSSHRTKIIINSNTAGSVSPRASDGAGYLSNDVRSGGMHIYTADNFYMTTDREYHTAVNGSSYTKFGNNCNVLVGARKDKPAYSTIPENTYENTSKEKPTKLNIESRNETNLLFRENKYLKLTSETPVHFRISSRAISKSRTGSGKVIQENFKKADEQKDSGESGNFYLTVTKDIHIVATGGIQSSINGIYNSRSFVLKANRGISIESVSGEMNLITTGNNCPNIYLKSGKKIILNTGTTEISGQLNVKKTSHFEGNVYINGSLFVNGIIVGIIPACKCGAVGPYVPPINTILSCSGEEVTNPKIAAIAESAEETKGYSEVDPKTKEISGVGDS